jgi:hypothetical protein
MRGLVIKDIREIVLGLRMDAKNAALARLDSGDPLLDSGQDAVSVRAGLDIRKWPRGLESPRAFPRTRAVERQRMVVSLIGETTKEFLYTDVGGAHMKAPQDCGICGDVATPWDRTAQ